MPGPSVNLLSLLRPETVAVQFHSRGWELNLHGATDWISAVALDLTNLAGIFPGAVHDEDLEEMFTLVLDRTHQETMMLCAQRALEAGAGRDWWWALNLTRKALGGWMYVNGSLVLEGVKVGALNYPDWLDAVYMLLWKGCDEEGRYKLDLELSMRPRGVKAVQSRQQTEAMLRDFAAD